MKVDDTMWNLRSLDVSNPTALVVCTGLDWGAGIYVYAPRREALFLGLCRKSLSPLSRVVFNFNPRAQLFRSLAKVFSISERLLDLTLNENDDAKIGAWLSGAPTSLGGQRNAENLLVILRAEVMYLFGSVCAVVAQHNKQDYTRFFDYFAAVNGQRDELVPLIVETVLGKELRYIFENLCGQYYFQSSSRQQRRKEWLFQAERVLSELCAAPFEAEWDTKQLETLMVYSSADLNVASKLNQALFLPMCSSNSEADTYPPLESSVALLLDKGATDFIYVNSFVEQLRWVERLAVSRQRARLDAVREDPLRSQSFFDARSGRSGVLILTDSTLNELENVLQAFPLTNFSLPVQETLETAFEVRAIRSAAGIPVSPQYDPFQLAQAFVRRTHPQKQSEIFATPAGLEFFISGLKLSEEETVSWNTCP
ncbi:MAG: hypothetical protein FJY29_04360 [Betaproteobacteria bacterium]|nr:hypothetical protein [Betaproteobacteria bacterium]